MLITEGFCGVQIPRLYNIYKAQGLLDNFEQMLTNLFQPLFEVTADPSSHPQLHIFLQQVTPPPPPPHSLLSRNRLLHMRVA